MTIGDLMTMRNRLSKGLAGVVLAGAALFSGCSTARESADAGLAGMAAGIATGSPGLFLLGAGTTAYAAGQAQGNGQTAQYQDQFFTCDPTMRVLQDTFTVDQAATFVADVPRKSERQVSLTLYETASNKQVAFKKVFVTDGNPRRVVQYPAHSFAPGVYTGVWRDNNSRYLGQKQIVVTGSTFSWAGTN